MTLRVSLIVIGCAIILLIFVLSRRTLDRDNVPVVSSKKWKALWHALRRLTQREQEPENLSSRDVSTPHVPSIDPDELEQMESIVPQRGSEHFSAEESSVIIELGSEQIAPAGEQLFIPLTIMAKSGAQISGELLRQAVKTLGLTLKDDGIYRYQVKDTQGYRQALLGLANILEPGTFDEDQLEQLATPGLVLYLHLPAPIEPREAFDCLIDIGQKLEQLLDAELCDETRSVLTKQTIGHLKEKVEAFRFKQKMTQLQRR